MELICSHLKLEKPGQVKEFCMSWRIVASGWQKLGVSFVEHVCEMVEDESTDNIPT